MCLSHRWIVIMYYEFIFIYIYISLFLIWQQGVAKPKGPLEALRPKLQVFWLFLHGSTWLQGCWTWLLFHCLYVKSKTLSHTQVQIHMFNRLNLLLYIIHSAHSAASALPPLSLCVNRDRWYYYFQFACLTPVNGQPSLLISFCSFVSEAENAAPEDAANKE